MNSGKEAKKERVEIKRLIGERVRNLRLQNKLSYRELSQRTGRAIGFLSDIEKGRTMPSSATLHKLAGALNTTVDYLVGRTDDPRPPTNRGNDS